MVKKIETGAVDDLNAEGTVEKDLNVDDLNVGSTIQDDQGNNEADDDSDDPEDETAAPEFVVMKGNCIRHDGEVYRENELIQVSGKDAERLLAAGVIADVQVLRQRMLSAVPAVSVTTE